jgi:hypothetical protein
MDIYFWTIMILRPLLALGVFVCIPRSLLPIKRGWKNDDQKALTRGGVLFVFGLMCLVLFISIINKG